ncbi:hypothetical protein YC2023_094792 [Brassica napus]
MVRSVSSNMDLIGHLGVKQSDVTENVVYADIYTMRCGVDSCNGSINGRQKALKVLDQAMPFFDRFEVARCSSMYKIIDHPFLIRFISPTIIDEVITGAPEINLQSLLDC